jgi:ACDE family multidrug resistance protein
MKASNRLTLSVILASATLTVMAGSTLSPVVALIREGLGVGPASVGLIITTHSLFVALFSPLMGILIDKIGTKKPFMLGLILYGLAGGSGLFINSYWPLIVSRALLGIGVAGIFNAVTVTILNAYAGSERNKIMGWRGSANSFGGILFPLLGGALGTFSWHLPFAVYLTGLPLGFLVLTAVPETRQEKSQYGDGDGSVWQVFRDNRILFGIYGLMFLAMILLYVHAVFLPQLLVTMGISNSFYISLIFTAGAISAALTALSYGRIKSRLSYKMIVLTGLGLWAVGLSAISQAYSVLTIVVSSVLIGIGRGIIDPTLPVWVGDIVPVWCRGRITSYLTTLGYVGQFSSPLFFAPVFSLLGFNGVFLVAGVICVPVFLLFLVFMKK